MKYKAECDRHAETAVQARDRDPMTTSWRARVLRHRIEDLTTSEFHQDVFLRWREMPRDEILGEMALLFHSAVFLVGLLEEVKPKRRKRKGGA
jgi:hypothetical protein